MWAVLKLKCRLMKNNLSLYLVMMAMSLVLAAVFSGSFGGNYRPTLAVADLDGSVMASDLLVSLNETTEYHVVLTSMDEGIEAVENGGVLALLVVNKDFYKTSEGLNIIQRRESIEIFQLSRLLSAQVQKMNEQEALIGRVQDVLEKEHVVVENIERDIKTVYDDHWRNKKPFNVVEDIFELVSEWIFVGNLHYLLGMTLFFVTYSILFTVGDFLEDKRLKTLNRMLVSPSTRLNILFANLIPALAVGIIQISVMVLSGQYLFGVEWGGRIPAVIAVGGLYIFTMTAMSLFMVSLVKNSAQLSAISPVLLTGMGMLGGCMWPLEIIQSDALLMLSKITPHRWAMASIQRIVIYGDWGGEAVLGILVLIAMGVGYLIAGERILYRKSLHEN